MPDLGRDVGSPVEVEEVLALVDEDLAVGVADGLLDETGAAFVGGVFLGVGHVEVEKGDQYAEVDGEEDREDLEGGFGLPGVGHGDEDEGEDADGEVDLVEHGW